MTAKLTTLERHSWLLLRAYPASYRRQRADEMLGTLLDTTPPGRTWPMPRDVIALLLGGLRARSGQDQRFSTPGSLRMAALLGCAVYLSFTALNYASYGLVPGIHTHAALVKTATGYTTRVAPVSHFVMVWQPPLIVSPFILAAALLPWFAGRKIVALGAALAGTVTVHFILATSVNMSTSPVVPEILEVLAPLAALVLLTSRGQRPPRLWLWLPCLVMALALPVEMGALNMFPLAPDPYLWLVPLAVVVAWFGVDARPAVALAVYFGLWSWQFLINYLQFHSSTFINFPSRWGWNVNPWAASLWADSRMWIATVLALTVLALWRVRRQAAL
jgi:hypothetical protein